MGNDPLTEGGPEYGRQAEAILKSVTEALNARAKEVKYSLTAGVAVDMEGVMINKDPNQLLYSDVHAPHILKGHTLAITHKFESDVKAVVELVKSLVKMIPLSVDMLIWRIQPMLKSEKDLERDKLLWQGYARFMYFQGGGT